MKAKRTGRLALAGVLTALALVFLLLTITPMATVALAAIAAVCGIPVVIELGQRAGLIHFAAVAVLALILVPTIEGKGIYIAFFGWYTVFKAFIESKNLPRLGEWGIKLAIFIVAMLAYTAVWVFLLDMPIPPDFALWIIATTLLCAVFAVYDIGLSRLIATYFSHIRPKIQEIFRFL